MIISDVVSMAAFVSVPVADWTGILTVGQLVVVSFVGGTARVFFRPAYQVLLPRIIDPEEVTEGNAKLAGSESAAQIAGPGLGGLLAEVFGAAAGLLADAVSFVVSLLCLAAVKPRPTEKARRPVDNSFRAEITEGLRFVWSDAYFRPMVLFASAANLTFTGASALIVVFLVRTVGLESGEVGLVMAIFGVGGIAGALVARPVAARIGTARTLLLTSIGCLPFALLLPLAHRGPGLLVAVAGILVTGGGVVANNVIAISFRQSYVKPEMLGRISSTTMTAAFAMMPAGSLMAGGLASALGTRDALWIMAGGVAASSLLMLIGPMRHERDLLDSQPDRTAEAEEGAPGSSFDHL